MQQMTDNREYNPIPENAVSAPSLSLLEAVIQLPWQYLKVLIRPSARILREEAVWARWNVVFVQFVLLVGITVGFNVLGHHIPGAALHTLAVSQIGTFKLFGWLPAPYNSIIFILASFLIGLCTAYPFSRLLKGRGRFVEHTYLLLLFTVPLVAISGALLLIPASGALVSALVLAVGALFVYRMILHALTIMAVHHLPVDKAIWIVLIIPIVLLLLGLAILVIVTLGKFLEVLGDFDFFDFSSSQGSGESESQKRRKRRRTGPYGS